MPNTLIKSQDTEKTFYHYKSNDFVMSNKDSTACFAVKQTTSKKDFIQNSFVYSYWSDNRYNDFKKVKKVIEFEQSFNKQLNYLKSNIEGYTIDNKYFKFYFRKTLDEIMAVNPDKLVLELTYEQGLLYTIVKKDEKVYLEFMPFETLEEEKATITLKDIDGNLKSYSGNIKQILERFVGQFESTVQTLFTFTNKTKIS